MNFDERDLLADPAFREAVLYELEMLHPLPPPQAEPQYYRSRQVPMETEALPTPRNIEVPRIVDADPPARHKGSHPFVLWGGGMLAVFVLAAMLIGTMAQAPKPGQNQVVASGCVNYTVVCKPSISPEEINKVLAYYSSPAEGQGQSLYDLGVTYGIDPAYPLAFFMNESTFGNKGMARTTLALSNERCIPDRQCVNTEGFPCQTGQSCYAQMNSWEDGFEHWYMLIKYEYVTGHINQVIGRAACPCTTISQIIPVYAPASDNNNESHYISVVEHAVSTWRSGKVVVA